MRKILLIFILTSLVMSVTSCYGVAVIRKDGPYEGRIIDADTGQPIEGVVVLGEWSTEIITPGGATHNFYNAQETVTDKNGEFSIEGLGLKILSNVTPMDVLIFKAGYEYIGMGPWKGLKYRGWKGNEESYDPVLKTKVIKPVYDPKKKIKWEGNKAIIPLKKLTMEERRKNIPPLPSGEAPYKKIKLMLNEYNKNSKELGLGIIDVWRDMR